MSAEDEFKSPIEDAVRARFKKGQYGESVPFIQEHLRKAPTDAPAFELLGAALRFSGDKANAAGALLTAADQYADAGHSVQSISARKKAMALNVEPEFLVVLACSPPAGFAAGGDAEFEAGEEMGMDIGLDLGIGGGGGIGGGAGIDMGAGSSMDSGMADAADIAEPPAAFEVSAPAQGSLGGFAIEAPSDPAEAAQDVPVQPLPSFGGFAIPAAPPMTQPSFGGFAPPDAPPTTEPSFGGFAIPEAPAAPQPSFGGFGIPEASPTPEPSFGGFGIPEASPTPEPSFGGFGIPDVPPTPEPSFGGFEIPVPPAPPAPTPVAPAARAPVPPPAPPPVLRIPTPLFDMLSDEEFAQLSDRLQPREFEENTPIVERGGPGDAMYVVAKGQVAVLMEQGKELVEVARLGPGDFFGEAALLTGEPRSATVTALTQVDCLELSAAALDDLVKACPHVREVMEGAHALRSDATFDSLFDNLQL